MNAAELRLVLKVAPWILIVLLGAALLVTRGKVDRIRLQAIADGKAANARAASAEAAAARRIAAASDAHAQRLAGMKPIILRSTDTVNRYAQTDEGRAGCLAPDRAAGVQQDRDALFAEAADTAGGGAEPVPAGAAPAPARRIDDQR